MKSLHRTLSVVLPLACLPLVLLASCTQKRPQVFTQGQGANLDTIESWSAKFIDVDTGEVIGTSPSTKAQDGVKIAPDVRSMNHFDLVSLKINDDKTRTLVGSPPFRGRPHSHGLYQLEIKLTDHYLKVYKVAKPEDLPFDEHFYKEETLRDGRIAIPIVGYKVKAFYRVEPQKTNDDQDSHHLIEVEEEDPAKASHVRIDWASRQVFEAVQSTDLFPAELFFARDPQTRRLKPYEWYYAETVIEKSLSDSSTIVGESANRVENSKLNPATKVVFLPREGELRVVNVARDERLSRDEIENGADLNTEATMLLPIQWKDYRTKAEGSSIGLKGEKVEERSWRERDYFEVDFLKLESAALVNTASSGVGTNRLIDVEVDQNYFSFTILNLKGGSGRKIHYSFLRADSNRLAYAPRRSFKEDRNTFGFFSNTRPFYPNWEYYTESDLNRRQYMSRMNPARTEITFHLSSDSPKEFADVAEAAIQAWDRGFHEALEGTGREMHIRFSPDPVQLGDLRYNVIHLVNTLNEDGLLGFGPSVTDPETGEIVAATTNVYVNSFQAVSASTVRQYIINRLEKTLDFGPGKSESVVADPLSLSLVPAPASKSRLQLALERKTSEPALLDDATEKKLREQALSRRCEYASGIAANTSDKEIRKYCPELEPVIAAHQNDDFLRRGVSSDNWEKVWTDARSAIRSCSTKITREKLLSTLIHEIGHNFGLRHNFYGSIDKANFKQIRGPQGETLTPQSSSIMEYTVWEEDRLTEAGPYDIAAIRFGYGDQVQLKDGSRVSLGAEQTIADAVKAKGKKPADLKPYLFCTDEEAYLSFDALCRPHDAGTTPREIVAYYIDLYERLQKLRRYRRVKPLAASSAESAADIASRVFVPLKEIYDQWRYYLGEYVRKSNRYLQSYSSDQYMAVLTQMQNDPVYGPIYNQYHPAAEDIFEFFRSVAFGSNQYCVLQSADGPRVLEFERLRDLLSEATRGASRIRNCAEAADVAELASALGEKSLKIVNETGYPLNSYRFEPATTTEESATDDVIGNSATRQMAAMVLALRYPNPRNAISKFLPSMIDEPHHLEKLAGDALDRVVRGVNVPGVDGTVPLFDQETTLYTQFWKYFRAALPVPNEKFDGYDLASTLQRLAPFSVYPYQPGLKYDSVVGVLAIDERPAFVATSEKQVLALALINTYNSTEEALKLRPVSDSAKAGMEALLKKALPPAATAATLKLNDFLGLLSPIKGGKDAKGETIMGFEDRYGGVYACIAQGSDAFTQVETLLTKLRAEIRQKNSDPKAMAALAETPLAEYVKAQLGQELKITQENIGPIGALVNACVEQQNQVVRLIGRYRNDYKSQQTLILNVLSAFAN